MYAARSRTPAPQNARARVDRLDLRLVDAQVELAREARREADKLLGRNEQQALEELVAWERIRDLVQEAYLGTVE